MPGPCGEGLWHARSQLWWVPVQKLLTQPNTLTKESRNFGGSREGKCGSGKARHGVEEDVLLMRIGMRRERSRMEARQ